MPVVTQVWCSKLSMIFKMKTIIIFAVFIGLSYQANALSTLPPTHVSHATHTTHTPHPTHAHGTHALHTTHTLHSTLAPHATHGAILHNQFVFHYDFITHKMIILNNHICYIFTLSDQEKTQVHTDATMMFLEAKLMLMIATSAKREVHAFSLDHHIQQLCGKGILHYYTFA